MAFDPNAVSALQEVRVSFSARPVDNALHSLFLLSVAEEAYGFAPWVAATAANLPPEQRITNQAVLMGLGYDFLLKIRSGEHSWASFSDFLDDLAAQEPYALLDLIVREMASVGRLDGIHIPDADMLVDDINLYMAYVDILSRHEEYDPAPFELAHALLNDPERLQATALSHLRVMWHEWMAPEWARTLPMIQASVEAFGRLDYSSVTVYEAIRRVTGRDMTSQLDLEEAADVRHIIFVPSPHCGPYLSLTVDGDIMRVIFGARMPPEPARLGHDELLMLLSALDDDMRMRILILLAQHDELCSQDIMDHFNLTQSTASRHLRQLSATGLLTEERSGGAKKCYRLNRDRARALVQTLRESLVEPHKPGNRNLPLRLQALFLLLV